MKAEMIDGLQVLIVNKTEMVKRFGHPYFGYTQVFPENEPVIYMREDLPASVYASVFAHEARHAIDRAFLDGRVWYWEARAWWAGFRADWRGFFQAIWMSVTDMERLRLYWQRIKKRF